jgi:hypothetical protein
MMKNALLVIWLVFVVALIVFVPLVTIWSLNTIFSTTIAYSIETWFATFWLTTILTAASIRPTINNRK